MFYVKETLTFMQYVIQDNLLLDFTMYHVFSRGKQQQYSKEFKL